ncbi:Mammalian cell entry related domain protein [Segniliparus rotundus DSM 44985]|uniref:Mammalian cell entry related domain protein n=1 Tax=Segniliparus rotundus (strain ATCC BAA-972 / CDC 1076 / CIP 108378 / DSM 44985 / JCM 13578) TaxID=640132 RepID=D6Z974_SEGRD|nr:MlaD family protein [Segniliparus rotundus]ADG98504.1 Mammalian cell entry related domain protein [Segniliparus rotundus DSM 44985]
MKAGSALLKFLAFALIVFVCSSVMFRILTSPVKGATDRFTAVFNDVSGLWAGGDVRMSGVLVGKVERVEPVVDGADPDNPDLAHAHVVFTLERKYPVYRDSRFAVRYQNLLGIRYLEIIPPEGPGNQRLKDGSVIRLNQTISAFDISTLFNGLKPIFDEVDPENLNKFNENLLLLMQGDTTNLGEVLSEIKTLSLFAQSRDELFRALFDQVSKINEVLPGKSRMILDLLQQFSGLFGAFADQNDVIMKTVDMTLRAEHTLIPLLSELETAYDELYGPVDAFLFRVLPQLGPIANMFAIAPELIPAPYESAQVGTDHQPRLAGLLVHGYQEKTHEDNAPEVCKPKAIVSPLGSTVFSGNVEDCA